METVSLRRKRSVDRMSFLAGGRGGRAKLLLSRIPAAPQKYCISLRCGPGFNGSAGASPSRVFAAAIRRLLEREAMTSPISPELSASRLAVRPQTELNGRHG